MIEVKSARDEEINLVEVIRILYNSKWIIIITTLIALLLGLIFNFNQNQSFKVSAPIGYGKSSVFINFIPINDILKENDLYLSPENPNGYKLDAQSVFEMFVDEFEDNEEMIAILEKNDDFIELTKNLVGKDKYELSVGIANSFKIIQKEDISSISFQWNNVEEGKILLQDAMKLTLLNVKASIINDLEKLASFIDMKNQRQVEGLRVALNLIEKELSSIESGSSSNSLSKENILMSLDYNALKETIVSLGKEITTSQLRNSLDAIDDSNQNEWVDYNLSLAVSESENSFLMNIAVFTVLGFIISCIYVLLFNFIIKVNEK